MHRILYLDNNNILDKYILIDELFIQIYYSYVTFGPRGGHHHKK